MKICILRVFTKQGVAHECGNNSKTLGGVQKNKRGFVLGILSEATLALQTSSG